MTRHPQARGGRYRTGVGLMIAATVCATALTIQFSMPAVAHHSFSAEFDSAREVRATGTVSGIEWMNPHAWFHLEVQELCERQGAGRDDDENEWDCRTPGADEALDWGFELSSPNGLMRLGWNRNSLQVDDRVTVEGTRARDNSPNANARSVTLADGRRLFAGSSEGSTP